MKYVISTFIALFFSIFGIKSQVLPLTPYPAEVKIGAGSFSLTSAVKIVLKNDSEELKRTCDLFLELVNPSTGLNIGYDSASLYPVIVELNPEIVHREGYHLKVSPQEIRITAQTPAGVFYAFQTLRQLLPPVIESQTMVASRVWSIPSVEIIDEPRFEYRGLMLDAARHFFPVSDVKRFIDLMAMHKYNHLHLHLADDQGWRIEIPAFPRLQTVAAWRRETMIGHLNDEPRQYDGTRHGGYYTQAELRELVGYAADRHVVIIPGIEMPGHATALLAAYPELGCLNRVAEVAREWGVFSNLLCPREDTFLFLERVLQDVMQIFPGRYVHIGGGESPKEQWQMSEFCRNTMIENDLHTFDQLHTWFMRRIARFVRAYGRQPIGWDEMFDGGDVSGAVLMSWRGDQGAIAAAQKGYNVIMSPQRNCFFDNYQSNRRNDEPLAQGGYLPLSMVYMYDPVPRDLEEEYRQFIVGAQGILRTEYVPDMRHAEYMTYPRACALAEALWTPTERKSYSQFLNRMREHSKRLEIMNVNFGRHFLGR